MGDYIDNLSDTIESKIDDIQETISDDFSEEEKLSSKLKISSDFVVKKKKFESSNISWETYRWVSIAIIFVSIFLANYIRSLFEGKLNMANDAYLMLILDILLVFLIFNLCIFLFYKTYYRYITTKKGAKGLLGKRGKRGVPGKNDNCDISTKKIGNFYREKEFIKKEVIENPKDNTVIDFNTLSNVKKGWYNSYYNDKDKEAISNKTIGIKCTTCNNSKISNKRATAEEITRPSTEHSHNEKPIIGASVNYNKNTNKITALQYLYDKNKNHNPRKHLIGNFGATKTKINAGTIGDYKNQTKGIERTNFTCPPNSAVYKVEGLYDNLGMRGLKFHCQDIKTGKLVKAYNNDNRKVYGVTFGIEPKPDNQEYHYDKSECSIHKHEENAHTESGTIKYIPSFISEVGGEYDSKKKNIQNLSFNKCSFYYDK